MGIVVIVGDIAADLIGEDIASEGFLTLMFGLIMICFSIGCITNIQYGKMLKDYIESKK